MNTSFVQLILTLVVPPLLVSAVYWHAYQGRGISLTRILASAHGLYIAAFIATGLTIGWFGFESPQWGPAYRTAFWSAFLLIGCAIAFFKGKKAVHVLQLVNLGWLFIGGFIGGMAITGIWL